MATTQRLVVRHRARARLRFGALGAFVLILPILAITWRIATQDTPQLAIHRTLAAYARIAGNTPALRWPREGQAAVEVEGVGSLGSRGASTPAPIASVAKMMTAYLTLLEHPLREGEDGFTMIVTAAENAEEGQRESLGESILPVRVGERITERQALQALLLPSANNIAAMLAVHDAGGLSGFVARMNATARKLGMSSTTYTDPSGFEPTTLSTATDQLKLARMAMREPAFATIVAERSVELPVTGRVANYDALVGEDGYVGVKTGSDRAAGGCLVFAKRFTIDGRTMTALGVVLGQREGPLIEAALASARELGDSAAAAVRVQTVIPAGAHVLSVSSTSGQSTTVVTSRRLQALGWAGLTVPVSVRASPAVKRLRAGETVASVTVHGTILATTTALARHALGGPSLGWRLRHLL